MFTPRQAAKLIVDSTATGSLESMAGSGTLAPADRHRVHGLAFRKPYQPFSLSAAQIPLWTNRSEEIFLLARHRAQGRSRHRVRHFECASVSGMAGYATHARGTSMGLAVGAGGVFHDRARGQSRRVSSELYSLSNGNLARRSAGRDGCGGSTDTALFSTTGMALTYGPGNLALTAILSWK